MNGAKVVKDETKAVLANLRAMQNLQLVAGVPAKRTGRKGDDFINNATLAFIHNNGSPRANIPSREFMATGIKQAQPKMLKVLKSGASEGLKDRKAVEKALNKAGLIASSSIKSVIVEQKGFEPLKSSAEGTQFKAEVSGSGTRKALIDTASMLNSITYEVRKT
jgi:hypothetical protein